MATVFISHAGVDTATARLVERWLVEDRHTVRTLQRRYVELWVGILQRMQPAIDVAVLRIRAHATFGLMNSTPYSGQELPHDELRDVLERMAFAALR